MLRWVRPYAGRVALAVGCMTLFGLASALPSPLIKPMLDGLFVSHDVQALVRIPLLLIGVFLIKGTANCGSTFLMRQVGQSVVADVRRQLFERIVRLPLRY